MRRLVGVLGVTGLLMLGSASPRQMASWGCFYGFGPACYSVPISPSYPWVTPAPLPSATPTPNPSATPTVAPTVPPTPTPTPVITASPPPTVPVIVSNATGSNPLIGGANVVVPAPGSITSGDLLVAVLSSGTETYTPPSGWTLYATEPLSGNSPQVSVFLKTATGSEPGTYTWVSSNGSTDAINAEILDVIGASTTSPINGMFAKYTSPAAVTIGTAAVSIPTLLSTLPIAINSILWFAPSNTGIPTGLTASWVGQSLAVQQNPMNFNDFTDNNGYNAIYAAAGPLTSSTSAAVTAGWTWGGASSNFTGTSVMLFVNPATAPAPTPTPTISPTPPPGGNCSLPFSAPLNYPDACYQPYAASSVWNRTIASYGGVTPDPSGPSYTSYYISHYWMFLQALSFGYVNQANQQQHPIYFGRGSDPADTVSAGCGWSGCVSVGQTFHIPSYAIPAGGSDHHLGVIDESNTTYNELDCWQASAPSAGVIHATSCSYQPVTTSGIMYGVTGAGYGLWAGIIRDQELIAGQINHALFLVTPCSSNLTVYPSESRSSDAFCSQGVPYGAWLRLNMTDAEILALGDPAYKVAILMAAAHYGAYMGDNNNTGVHFQAEADQMYTAAGYTSAGCSGLPSGAPCTPLTAYFHSLGDPGWDGTAYRINLSEVSGRWQWLMPPAH